MKDEMLLIYKALKNDSSFMALMGGKTAKFMRIYNNPVCPSDNEFPRATMIETLVQDSDFYDNEAEFNYCHVRIDFWHNKNALRDAMARAKEVLEKTFDMISISFGADMYENDTGIYHKQLEIELKL